MLLQSTIRCLHPLLSGIGHHLRVWGGRLISCSKEIMLISVGIMALGKQEGNRKTSKRFGKHHDQRSYILFIPNLISFIL